MPGELVTIGLQRLDYDRALALQHRLRDKCSESGGRQNYLLLVEHPPTITLGIKGNRAAILAADELLAERGVCVRNTNRGGEATFHGPGQLVAYPILDLRKRGRSLRRYLSDLETWLVHLCRKYGMAAHADSPHTGVWVADRKVASIGIAARRWISYHGVALNISTDLTFFDLIVPCGLTGVTVTSMERELGTAPPLDQVAERAAELFVRHFEMHRKGAESGALMVE